MSSSSSPAATAAPAVHAPASAPSGRRARVLRGAAADRAGSAGMANLPALLPSLGVTVSAEQVEEVLEAARMRGHSEGYAHGYAAGLAKAAAELEADLARRAEIVDAALAALAAAAADLRARHVPALAEVEDAVATAAFEIATAVVGRELELATAPGREAVARALRLAAPEGPAVVRLHPDDVDTVGSLADLAPGRELAVVPDAGVDRHGCIVEVGACRVDAQLATALERAREALRA